MMLSASVLLQGAVAWCETATGTSFTYQGRLNSSGVPASGAHDLEFGLYDASSAGAQVGTTVSLTATVTGGLFSAELDFGNAAFVGKKRWLEVQVRPSGGGTYASLLPRT